MASWRTDHVLERLIGTSDTPKERNLPPLASPNLSPCGPPPVHIDGHISSTGQALAGGGASSPENWSSTFILSFFSKVFWPNHLLGPGPSQPALSDMKGGLQGPAACDGVRPLYSVVVVVRGQGSKGIRQRDKMPLFSSPARLSGSGGRPAIVLDAHLAAARGVKRSKSVRGSRTSEATGNQRENIMLHQTLLSAFC